MKKKGSKQDPPNAAAIGKERNRANRRRTLYGAAYVYGLLFAFCGVLMDLAGHSLGGHPPPDDDGVGVGTGSSTAGSGVV